MNVYQVSEIEFEPLVILTDHHERAIGKFQWALAGALGFLPPVNFALSWIDPTTLPSYESLEQLIAEDLEGFADCTSGRWERFDFR